jgi:imidazolonepropionase
LTARPNGRPTPRAGGGPRVDLLIHGAAELITCVPRDDDPLGRWHGGSVAVADQQIVAAGPDAAVATAVDASTAEHIDASGRVVAPGFVDSHTHLVFGGSRVREYAARLTRSPEEVAELGIPTGIQASVAMTRTASSDELYASASARLDGMMRHGTTTVESKSGYGLRTADEIRMLEVNRRLQADHPVDVVSTFLGAHDFPPDIAHDIYLAEVIDEMIPEVERSELAEFCDVFLDEGYYDVEQARLVLAAGLEAGLGAKIHTDQYSELGGAPLAAELAVVSADHLNYTRRPAMRELAHAGVIGVVTPVLDFAVRHPRPFDARAMLDEGMTLAIATDLCPGCWVESMHLALEIACRTYSLSVEEAVLAATVGGAKASALQDRGALAPGLLADIQIWDIPTTEDLVYRLGDNPVHRVIKRGRTVV